MAADLAPDDMELELESSVAGVSTRTSMAGVGRQLNIHLNAEQANKNKSQGSQQHTQRRKGKTWKKTSSSAPVVKFLLKVPQQPATKPIE